MAKVGEEEIEYESDPDEEKQFFGRRRREAASDDEEAEGEEKLPVGRRGPIHSDESDGQGGAAEYDDDEEEEQEVYEDEEDEEEVYEDEGEDLDVAEDDKGRHERREGSDLGSTNGASGVEAIEKREADAEEETMGNNVGEEGGKEGKKENEPFSVPTAGTFYMHDDRFRDNAGGRHRHTFGGRKLWELKDDKKWGHDKFEEMSMQERRYEQGRRGLKGNYRGRDGKNRGPNKGYTRSRSKAFSNDENQSQARKTVRGRGPRKYEATMRNSGHSRPMQDKQSRKPLEKVSHGNSGRTSQPTSSNEAPPARKQSSLSSASPPFYPSGTSNKEVAFGQKRDVQVGSTSRNFHASGGDESFSVQQVGAVMRGKNPVDSVAIDKLYISDSVNPVDGKGFNNMQMSIGGSSSGNTIQTSQSRAHGRDLPSSMPMTYQPITMHGQVNRVSSATQIHAVQRSSSQGRIPHSVHAANQQLGQRSGTGSQGSPPKTLASTNSCESAELETTSESNKSKTALVGKGKSAVQSNGRGFSYGGTQVMGSMGNVSVGHGDQNFPAFLPVMQFGAQNRGGMTVPALGMAFPGYVANPQLGVGNSEMTWLPVLTGAAGALGATYCPPYIAVDGAYHAHSSGQTSSAGSLSKENSTGKLSNERQSSQREIVSDDSGQRQKPRRYSEMDFKQPNASA